jgi:hypothetical protein
MIMIAKSGVSESVCGEKSTLSCVHDEIGPGWSFDIMTCQFRNQRLLFHFDAVREAKQVAITP